MVRIRDKIFEMLKLLDLAQRGPFQTGMIWNEEI